MSNNLLSKPILHFSPSGICWTGNFFLIDDQARVVPGTLVSEVLNVLDVLVGGRLGVPCHNVGQQSDLLARTLQQVLNKARIPRQDLVPQGHVSCG